MHDAGCTSGGEAVSDLQCESDEPLWSVAGPHRRAFDELHDEVVRPHVVELTHVWLIECGNGPRFTLEAIR